VFAAEGFDALTHLGKCRPNRSLAVTKTLQFVYVVTLTFSVDSAEQNL